VVMSPTVPVPMQVPAPVLVSLQLAIPPTAPVSRQLWPAY
jgi:hypothetical protein